MIDLVVDIGSNWNGDLKRAMELIRHAKDAGADAAKFQLYRGNQLYNDPEKQAALRPFELPQASLYRLRDYCEKINIEFMCTAFFLDAVDWLESVGVKRHKIASWDINYEPLIRKVAKTGKPIVLSTGGSTLEEIDEALEWILADEKQYAGNITILHCTGNYPALDSEANLLRIKTLRNYLDEAWSPLMPVGLSSHLTNVDLVAASVMVGAEMIEVHFDLGDRAGNETGHSLTPKQLLNLRMKIDLYEQALGDGDLVQSDVESTKLYRRQKSLGWLRP